MFCGQQVGLSYQSSTYKKGKNKFSWMIELAEQMRVYQTKHLLSTDW